MIAIIDYNAGNIKSVTNAFEYLEQDIIVTNNKSEIESCNAIIVPGVGAFEYAMKSLRDLDLIDFLGEQVLIKKKPYLGICLGLQILADRSYENGKHEGLGWISGEVRKLKIPVKEFKVPHIGWNNVYQENSKKSFLFSLFYNIEYGTDFYFLHSYTIECKDKNCITSFCYHGGRFVSSIEIDNIYAVQFHPEKSQKAGIQLLKNFIGIVNA